LPTSIDDAQPSDGCETSIKAGRLQARRSNRIRAQPFNRLSPARSGELKGLVEGSMVKLTLPTSLDAEHQQMLNELNAKGGKDFDNVGRQDAPAS
jgi:predicted outer membrane protein